jgi:hypothetical protein
MTRRQDLAVADDHTTDARVRAGQEQAFGRLIERSAHGSDVIEGWVGQGHGVCQGADRTAF